MPFQSFLVKFVIFEVGNEISQFFLEKKHILYFYFWNWALWTSAIFPMNYFINLFIFLCKKSNNEAVTMIQGSQSTWYFNFHIRPSVLQLYILSCCVLSHLQLLQSYLAILKYHTEQYPLGNSEGNWILWLQGIL